MKLAVFPLLVLFSLMLTALVVAEELSSESEEHMKYCLTKQQVKERLASAPTKRLTRVTNPSTASTEFRQNIGIVQGDLNGDTPRFDSYNCDTLCFETNNDNEENPFVGLEFLNANDGHHAFDTVLQMANDDSPYLMTTLRDPVDYAIALYKRRKFWDNPVENIDKLSFVEWLNTMTWRSNQFTRMMGRQASDKRVLTNIMDPKPTDVLKEDAYMTAQNELGAESEVLKTAWQRVSQELHWFGLFHRLPESMELLAYTFCSDAEKLQAKYTKPPPPSSHVKKLHEKYVGNISDEEKQVIVNDILQRNQLDSILFERANALFDQRLEEMRETKQNGILCKFGGTVNVTCGDDDDMNSNTDDGHKEL